MHYKIQCLLIFLLEMFTQFYLQSCNIIKEVRVAGLGLPGPAGAALRAASESRYRPQAPVLLSRYNS